MKEYLSALIRTNNSALWGCNDLVVPVTVSNRIDVVDLEGTFHAEAQAAYLSVSPLTPEQTREVAFACCWGRRCKCTIATRIVLFQPWGITLSSDDEEEDDDDDDAL